jgi:hypothetical protein
VQFAQVMVYYFINAVQTYVQDLGFELQKRAIPFDVEAEVGANLAEFNNADQSLRFGVYEHGTSAAADGKIVVHEYAHALQAAAVGDRFDREIEGQAISEGFADYFAFSFFAGVESDDCRTCLGAFMTGGTCYRNLVKVPLYDDRPSPNERHKFGRVWASALFSILDAMHRSESLPWDDARKLVDRGIFLGHERISKEQTTPEMPEAARAILSAVRDDQVVRPYLETFCAGFAQGHILDISECKSIKNPPIFFPVR